MKKVLALVLSILFLSGCSITPIKELNNNAKRFSQEYSNITVDEENPMVYKTDKEIIEILKSGTGIIYFGFPECPWCQNAVPVLIETAKEMSIDQVYYFNPKTIRENNTDTYQEIVKLLDDNLLSDETGNKRIYVPDVYFISEGKVVGHHYKTVDSQTDPKNSPLTELQKSELKNIYKGLISKTYNLE